jgi:hypothetical protein
MRRARWTRRAVGVVAWSLLVAPVAAQHEPPPSPPRLPATATKSDATQKRGAADAPTHAPQPTLPPLAVWQHVATGNAAAAAAIAAGLALPKPAERPAGGGRWLCAVLVCSDLDVDVAPLLGVARSDVLLLSTPGPFATPEITAQLERAVADERLSFVLVLTHESCRALQARAQTDALVTRAAAVAAEATRRQLPLPKAMAQLQREQLLAASELLRDKTTRDELRIVPASLDGVRGVLTWHHARADALPLAPVK